MAGAFHGIGRARLRDQHRRERAGRGQGGRRPISSSARAPTAQPWARSPRSIKSTAFRVTRVGELIGREVAARLDVAFGIVDLSRSPRRRRWATRVGEILQAMGVHPLWGPRIDRRPGPAQRRREEGRQLCVQLVGRRPVGRVRGGLARIQGPGRRRRVAAT